MGRRVRYEIHCEQNNNNTHRWIVEPLHQFEQRRLPCTAFTANPNKRSRWNVKRNVAEGEAFARIAEVDILLKNYHSEPAAAGFVA